MKKSVIRNSFIVILLISNTLFIYKWWNAPERRHGGGPRNEIIDRLHFDDQQVKEYDILIRAHRSAIEKAEHKLMRQKQQLYANLDKPFSETILEEILKTEAEIEHIHFNHFKDIEALCKPNQKAYFKALNKEIADLFSPGKKPPHR